MSSCASIRGIAWAPLIAVVAVMLVIQSFLMAPALNSLFTPVSLPGYLEKGVTYALQFVLMSGNAVILAMMLFLRQVVARRRLGDGLLLGQVTERGLAATALLSVWSILLLAVLEDGDWIAVWLVACVPTLVISFAFLWFAVNDLRNLGSVGLLLAGYVVLTACFQVGYTEYGREEPGEMILILNSTLIGLAIAVWLLMVSRSDREERSVMPREGSTAASAGEVGASPE